MARRSDHSREEIREMALEAAENIVVEQGLEGLSARKVATAIGYTVGTLYLVFENIDDLILQINARTLDRLYAKLAETQAPARDARDRLLQLGQAYIQFADQDPHRWSMIFEHRLAEGRELPEWYQRKIARMFAIPKMRERPYPLLLDRDGQFTARFPSEEAHVTFLVVERRRITDIRHLAEPDAIADLLSSD